MWQNWLYWSRRVTPWLFYAGSVLFFLAFVLQYLRSGQLNGMYFFFGALMAIIPGLIGVIEKDL